MQRKARSRSDAPRLIAAFGTPLTIIGTTGGIGCITTGIVVVDTGSKVTGSIAIATGVRISAGIIVGVGCMSSPRRAIWRIRTRRAG